MRLKFILGCALLATASAMSAYSPVKGHIMTEWGENIDPQNVWKEYPRPMMERPDWLNLNGLWDYAITAENAGKPGSYQGEILVPFPVESALSGVGKTVGKNNALWYSRSFDVPKSWKGKDVLLNFGAVDWKADVWVNGIKVGSHKGGYTPFSLNITPALSAKGKNELVVRVWDPTDEGYQPRGKQVCRPDGIWYTPVTGIWQTVWLEPVSPVHISDISIVPDIDRHTLTIGVTSSDATAPLVAEAVVKDGGRTVASGRSINGNEIVVDMPSDAKLWTPDSPELYDVEVSIMKDGKVLDKVDSYTAMRKFSTARDDKGIVRFKLNNEDIFQFGPLDQGWWPDGLYTAPSYDAMVSDVALAKNLGFNMIRKHVKVEPALWYEYCDKNGIIVWQDMPNGDRGPDWQNRDYFKGSEAVRSAESEANYRRELREMIDLLRNHPCISVWVPFNESWGQFKTAEIADWVKAYDPTRLVNPASGGNFYPCGDILDLHNYPGPDMYLSDPRRANVLGEYGGIGMVAKDHIWSPDRNWGYVEFKTPAEVTDRYVMYAGELADFVDRGFTGAVYTQTSDVEGEINGLITYDRKLVKVDKDRVRKANREVIERLKKK